MKLRTILLSLFVLTLLSLLFVYQTNTGSGDGQAGDRYKMSKQQRISEAYKLEFEKTHDPRTNTIPSERLKKAKKIAAKRLSQNALKGPADAIPDIEWEERGPNNVGGRTRAILVDGSDNSNNTVWAAGVAGGIWKTTNFQSTSPTWIKSNDFFENMAVTVIYQDPNNTDIMYFGTGEGWFNGDAMKGLGIWKSTNGGDTWNQLPSTNSFDFYYIQDIIIDSNGNLYAATHRGLYRSSDEGSSWSKVLGSQYESFGDLEIGADGDLYATSGRYFYSGAVYKSDLDTHGNAMGGSGTWTDITPTGDFWRIALATAPSNSNRVYILCEGANSADVTAIYRSDNASGNSGVSWTSLPIPNIIDQGSNSIFTRGQAWYDLFVQVDPNDADVVFIGGVDALRSTDAGANWTQMTTWSLYGASGYSSAQNVHADHHNFIFMPNSSSNAIITTDGGLFYSTDANNTSSYPSWQSKNTGYNVTQFYACATSNEEGGNRFLAGAQDNGSQRFLNEGMNTTTAVSGGDGAFCHIDQDNANIQITSYVYNNYYITSNAWGSTSYQFESNDGRFINPTDYDSETNILYGAADTSKYSIMTNVGSSNTYSTTTLSNLTEKISAVSVSPNTQNRVFFGDNAGNILKVDNAHTSNPVSTVIGASPALPSSYVSCIAIENGDDDHLLVTFSNYGVNSVYETTNGGTSWTNIEGDLPDMPVRWAEFNPNLNTQAMLATELGVWTTNNLDGSNTKWGPSNAMLANTRVDMLQIRPVDNFVLAATHGRGLFTSESFMASSLPVVLEDFDGAMESSNVMLRWRTSSERNSDYFEVQHSTDGRHFESIGKVNANGTTSDENTYSYKHGAYKNGLNYYRLKQVDLDGDFEYSKIITVVAEDFVMDDAYSVAPNPFSTHFTLKSSRESKDNIRVALYNKNGQLMEEMYNGQSRSSIKLSLSNADIDSGLYFIEVLSNSGQRQVIKVYKQ